MNGRIAKRIRKRIYGRENSPRHRKYMADVKEKESFVDGVKKIFKKATIFDAGLRSDYQKAKREYKMNKGGKNHGEEKRQEVQALGKARGVDAGGQEQVGAEKEAS